MKIDFNKKISWPVAMTSIILLLLFVIILFGCSDKKSNSTDYQNNQYMADNQEESLGLWMKDFEITHPDDECANKVATQITYLKNEKLSDVYTFDKYKITDIQTTNLADLNVYSSKYTNYFRGSIRRNMEPEGVNFAGHYSLVNVGMTGWGNNYFIIDRKTGNAYIFPYKPYSLEFKPDSNLLIMDSKESIWAGLEETSDFSPDSCIRIYNWLGAPIFYDLRPIYFLWQNNKLIQLDPKDIKPTKNIFWNWK